MSISQFMKILYTNRHILESYDLLKFDVFMKDRRSANTPLVKLPTSTSLSPSTPNGAMAKPIPTRRFSTAGSIGSSPTQISTKPSSKPLTAKTSGFTSHAAPTRSATENR